LVPGDGIYPILITSALMHAPARDDHSLLGAIVRLHTCPANYHEPGTEEFALQTALWFQAFSLFLHMPLDAEMGECTTLELFCSERGRKGTMYLQAQALAQREGWFCPTAKLVPKFDEVLYPGKTPRPVLGNDPVVMAVYGPVVEGFINLLKETIDGWCFQTANGPLYLDFGGGKTQVEHSRWRSNARRFPSAWHVTCSGDDSLTIAPGGEEVENDFSKFDQSHSESLKLAELQFFSILGWTEIVELTESRAEVAYKSDNRRFKVTGNAGVGLSTGDPRTYLKNSMDNAVVVLLAVHTWKPAESFAVHFQDLCAQMGFTSKVTCHQPHQVATYLKSMWVPGSIDGQEDVEDVFMSLPSCILKAGKMLVDYRVYGLSVEEAASAVASSYGAIPEEMPISGVFFKKLRELGRKGKEHIVPSLEHSFFAKPVVGEGVHLNRTVAMAMCQERYGVSRQDILEAEAVISSVTALPSWIHHPMFHIMAARDYG